MTPATCPMHSSAEPTEAPRAQEEERADTSQEPFDMHAPDSITIRSSGDIRMMLMSGRTFLMQVAHPAVGAGVWEHSAFRQDPWSRLREIDLSGQRFVFSGKQASKEEGARLRYLHRNIQGIDNKGRAYHSLDPQVYGWVHTVFLDSTVAMYELYGTPLTRAEQEQLFIEWRQAGRMFGLKDRDMPGSLDAYWSYFAEMIETELEYNPVVDHILKSGAPPKPPSFANVPTALWKLLWKPVGLASHKLILGSLPKRFREKIAEHAGVWTDEDEQSMERFRRFVRATVPRLPEKLRYTAPARRAMCPV